MQSIQYSPVLFDILFSILLNSLNFCKKFSDVSLLCSFNSVVIVFWFKAMYTHYNAAGWKWTMDLLGILNNWSKEKNDQIPVLGSLTSVASVFKKQPFFVFFRSQLQLGQPVGEITKLSRRRWRIIQPTWTGFLSRQSSRLGPNTSHWEGHRYKRWACYNTPLERNLWVWLEAQLF